MQIPRGRAYIPTKMITGSTSGLKKPMCMRARPELPNSRMQSRINPHNTRMQIPAEPDAGLHERDHAPPVLRKVVHAHRDLCVCGCACVCVCVCVCVCGGGGTGKQTNQRCTCDRSRTRNKLPILHSTALRNNGNVTYARARRRSRDRRRALRRQITSHHIKITSNKMNRTHAHTARARRTEAMSTAEHPCPNKNLHPATRRIHCVEWGPIRENHTRMRAHVREHAEHDRGLRGRRHVPSGDGPHEQHRKRGEGAARTGSHGGAMSVPGPPPRSAQPPPPHHRATRRARTLAGRPTGTS